MLEQGKTFSDAKGDVLRGLQVRFGLRAYPTSRDVKLTARPCQVVDAACAMPSLIMGEKLEVSKDMDTETRRVPLGVGAAICP